jgi:transposase
MSSTNIQFITIPPELEAEMTPAVRVFVKTLLDRIEQLERGRKTPQNSSLPPSTQHPHARPQPLKHKSKKKRGGQPGHEKHERPLIPTDQCDDVQPLKPAECRRCGAKLSGSDPEPLRHQVWDRLACPCCGETTCAELPLGVPQGQSGPRLMAFTAVLMAYFRQSKRRTAEFLTTLLNQPCCPATVVKMQNQVTAALRPSYEVLAAQLPTQEHLNIDETATKEAGGKAWLWTFVARLFTVFSVRATREATALSVFLGEEFRGIVTCDRAKMYWRMKRLQWCWAHLKRDFQAMIDTGNPRSKWLGERLRAATCKLFEHWADYRAGKMSRFALVRRMGPIRRKVEQLLLRGMQSGNRDVRGTCRELYEHRGWLWTFLQHEGVEPTNNAGERSLRHAVIWRKLSFGTQSATGSRFVETMLTVIETCRQQHRNAFAFVTAAVEAHLAHQSAPSLLPRM